MKESQLENKTTIAQNDYMRMVDENNNSVKIKKDSFMAAIKDALPSIISDGATGSGSVLSVINGALKTRTDANLASVLGAYLVRIGGDGSSHRISINNPYKTPFTRGFFIACNSMRTNNYGLFWASGSNVVALSENECYIQAENITEGAHAGIHYDGGYVTFYTQDQDEVVRFYALYY